MEIVFAQGYVVVWWGGGRQMSTGNSWELQRVLTKTLLQGSPAGSNLPLLSLSHVATCDTDSSLQCCNSFSALQLGAFSSFLPSFFNTSSCAHHRHHQL